jgi:hypothetical protein
MNKTATERLGPLAGLVFAALLLIMRVIEGSGMPDAGASTATAVRFWTDHQSEQIAAAIISSFAALFLVWFGSYLRSALRDADGGKSTLADISFGGVLVTAAGILAIATVELAAADTAGDVPGQVTQTLSALQAESYLGVAAGFGLFGIATGLAIMRTGVLSRRLGWLSLVSGVIWLTPVQFVAIFLSVAFVVVTSIRLYRPGRSKGAVPVTSH